VRKLKLSLQKEIISDLETNMVKGGDFNSRIDCTPKTAISVCKLCVYTEEEEYTCKYYCEPR
jgi:hypothetical protein